MPRVPAFHTSESETPAVYHNNSECHEGKQIKPWHRVEGEGTGRRLGDAVPSINPPLLTLFRRLRRFRPTAGRDAYEDRLTEALAATLEGAPAATRELVSRWFDARPAGALQVATQRWAALSERID